MASLEAERDARIGVELMAEQHRRAYLDLLGASQAGSGTCSATKPWGEAAVAAVLAARLPLSFWAGLAVVVAVLAGWRVAASFLSPRHSLLCVCIWIWIWIWI